MLPIGSVGILTMVVAAYPAVPGSRLSPTPSQGGNPQAASRIQRSARCGDEIRDALPCPPTCQA